MPPCSRSPGRSGATPFDQQATKDALAVAKRVGITSKSRQQDRRPTLAELDRLLTHFIKRQTRRAGSAPMARIIAFDLFSIRRLEEITRIRRADLDVEGGRILVRDMKNPGEKIGNDVWCDVPRPAMALIQAMPRAAAEIFPFKPDAISTAFTRVCPLLGIEDLHFHDLRHESVSLLCKQGLNIPHATAVSGHRSWTSLKRFTHVRQTGDKYAGWALLNRLSTQEAA